MRRKIDILWQSARRTSWLPPLTLVLTIYAGWIAAARIFALPTFILPRPRDVLYAAWETRELLSTAIISTTFSAGVGLLISLLLAGAMACAMDMWPFFRKSCYPLIVLSQTIQILAVAPLIVIWLGFGAPSTLFITVLFCFFPITITFTHGLASTPHEYIAQLSALHATRWQIWRYARLPAALPSLFSGLRVASAYALIAATIGEWVGGTRGIGVYLLRSKNALQTDRVFAGMLICSLMSIALFGVVVSVERLITPWHTRSGRHLFDPAHATN